MSKPRIPTDNEIVDAFHGCAALVGRYDADDCITAAIGLFTEPDADDDMREAVSVAVRRVWRDRFEIMGA